MHELAVPQRRHTVYVPGEVPLTIDGSNWLVALGTALDLVEWRRPIGRLACEVLPSGAIVAHDPASGDRFVIHRGVRFDPDLEPSDAFELDLPPDTEEN